MEFDIKTSISICRKSFICSKPETNAKATLIFQKPYSDDLFIRDNSLPPKASF